MRREVLEKDERRGREVNCSVATAPTLRDAVVTPFTEGGEGRGGEGRVLKLGLLIGDLIYITLFLNK